MTRDLMDIIFDIEVELDKAFVIASSLSADYFDYKPDDEYITTKLQYEYEKAGNMMDVVLDYIIKIKKIIENTEKTYLTENS